MHDICVYTHMWHIEHVGLMRHYHKKPCCFCFLYSAVLLSQETSSSAPGWKHEQSHAFSEHT